MNIVPGRDNSCAPSSKLKIDILRTPLQSFYKVCLARVKSFISTVSLKLAEGFRFLRWN